MFLFKMMSMKFDAGGMFPYLMLWYIFVVLVLSVIVVVIVVKYTNNLIA